MATTPTSDKPPPQWMLLLEKKKNRPHRLAHEIGAGAPCLSCGEKCPGLDLHFWRKVCRNCKCKKEEHDVQDDDGYAQFEILLGEGKRRKKPGAVLKMKAPDADAAVASKQFDWVPPDVSEDVAAEYMQQLPAAKLPISGSDGALYRRQQLEKQMPPHDLDAARCHNLTPQEIEQLQKYLDNLKNNVVGQGRVTKIPGLYLEQRHWYGAPGVGHASSTQLPSSRSDQSLHPLPPLPHLHNAVPRPFRAVADDHEENLPPPLPDSLPPDHGLVSLRTPGSFIPGGQQPYKGSLASSQRPGDLAHSQGGGQNPEYSEAFRAAQGSTLSSQFPSSITNSSKVPGTFIPGQGSSLQHTGSNAQYGSDGSAIYSKSQHNLANSSAVPGRFVPEGSKPLNQYDDSKSSLVGDGLAVLSNSTSRTANSTGVGGKLNPGHNLNFGQSGNVPGTLNPNEGSAIHSHGQSNVANSTGVGGKFYPGTNQSFGQSGNVPGSKNPNEGSAIHSHGQSNVANSSGVGGKFYPGTNQSFGQSGNVPGSMNPNEGSANHSLGQSNVANSSGVGGKFYPGTNQSFGQSGNVPGSMNPNEGSANHSHGQSNVANSSGVGGKFYPGTNQSFGQSGNIPATLNPNGGSAIHSHGQSNIANSSGVGGKFNPGQNLHEHTYSNVEFHSETTPTLLQDPYYSTNPSNLEDGAYPGSNRPGSEFVGSNRPGSQDVGSNRPGSQDLGSNRPGREGMGPNGESAAPTSFGADGRLPNPSMPLSARFEHSSVPLAVASSTEISGDSMPRSAQVIRQSNVVDNELAAQLEELSAQALAVPSGLRCRRCDEALAAGEVAVFADRAGADAAWHPRCFACRTCSELLADLVYFFGRGDVYCGRHYAALLDIPRCRACDELIFVKEYTVAEGMTFHVKHFSCYECDEPLAGKQYVPVDDMPTCLDCYQDIFGKRCDTCRLQIPAGQRRVGWKELSWHAAAECFRCASCATSLLDGKFVMSEQKPFCNKGCAAVGPM